MGRKRGALEPGRQSTQAERARGVGVGSASVAPVREGHGPRAARNSTQNPPFRSVCTGPQNLAQALAGKPQVL
jgi:hypothetical protein